MDPLHTITISVTPVVLISACGLITLALYNRLGAILARIRAFHQQKIELLLSPETREGEKVKIVLGLIDSQITKVTAKAKAIQNGLYCLLAAVVTFLICSLFGVAAAFHEFFGVIALVVHILGLVLFLCGVGWAMRELSLSLTPLEEENAQLAILTAAHSQHVQPIRIAKSA